MGREVTVTITGEAGQGIQTAGMALCGIFKRCGFHVFANQDYMSRVRGGNNFFQLRISDEPVYAPRRQSDIIIALDKESVPLHTGRLAPGGVMVIDAKTYKITADNKSFIDAPLYEMAASSGGSPIFASSVATGLVLQMLGGVFSQAEDMLKSVFSGKEEGVAAKNIEAARLGYEFGAKNVKAAPFTLNKCMARETLLLNGNEAMALGAIKAGCKFYSAYPMSPSTGIMNVIAQYSKDLNIVVEQAEDEIAAINMILGASFAGARSMTATSGGGFALMVEGLSLAAMTETPIVVADVQRPAPATGFPTRTEQADLDFLLSAGHGEFARVIYAPGTAEEAFYLTMKAFNVAEKYQIPVLIMSDQYLADSYRDIEKLDIDKIKVERHLISKEDSKVIKNYQRYALTESGISPRAVPSWIDDVIYADSDEHTETGHITEDAAMRVKMVEKRLYKKMAGLSKEIEAPSIYNIDKADIILIGFGSTYGVMKEACEKMPGGKAGFIHLSQVWPFPEEALKGIFAKKNTRFLTVENNAGGQLAALILRQTGFRVGGSILKFDGRPFDLDGLMEKVKEMAQS